jgi:tRNA-2-methylthio-N6-dimethylallyladenosine synthase
VEDVLVEGPSKQAVKEDELHSPSLQMTGRTHADRIVVFPGNLRQAGQFLPVRITGGTPFTLYGEVVTHEFVSITMSQPVSNSAVY